MYGMFECLNVHEMQFPPNMSLGDPLCLGKFTNMIGMIRLGGSFTHFYFSDGLNPTTPWTFNSSPLQKR